MWSGQRLCRTVTNSTKAVSSTVCVCLCAAPPPPLPCQFVCSYTSPTCVYVRACTSFCLCALTRARRLGCVHGRQVRHVEGTGRFLERTHLSVSLDGWRARLNTSVCQLSSAWRGTGVYSSSLLLLGLTSFPVAPGACQPTRPDMAPEGRRSATRHRLGHPLFAVGQKLKNLFLLLLKN